MKELICCTCGDSVYLADNGERLEGYETPIEHLERTGHAPRSPPEMMACEDCGNIWAYTGEADRPTCSNCRGKRTYAVAGD